MSFIEPTVCSSLPLLEVDVWRDGVPADLHDEEEKLAPRPCSA